MKKNRLKSLLLIFAAFIALILGACKKELAEKKLEINKSLIAEARVMAAKTNSKIAFSMLNAEEQYFLVQEQLQYILTDIPLNPNQEALIQKIKKEMPENLYANFEVRKLFAEHMTSINKEIGSILGSKFAAEFLARVVDIKSTVKRELPTPDEVGAGKDCKCSASSDYCEDTSTDQYKCSLGASTCTASSVGCGTILMYSCDGLCLRVLGE